MLYLTRAVIHKSITIQPTAQLQSCFENSYVFCK